MTTPLPLTPELASIEALDYGRAGAFECGTFWGSHGCDRPAGHDLPHVCGHPDDEVGVCTVHDGGSVRFVVWANKDERRAGIGEDVTGVMLGEPIAMPTFRMD